MTPEIALLEAVQIMLLADAEVAALVGGKVYDEVPSDNQPGKPPLVYVGPIHRQRLADPEGSSAWTMRMRLYAESTDFGRREAWEIASAVALALDDAELTLPDPFQAADVVRVMQAGDVFDDGGRFKTTFVDVSTTIQRIEA